jgi:hypothetical protein
MAKNGGRKSAKLEGPLYESGRMNGPVGGPKGGARPKDPLGYLNLPGQAAPSGRPSDRGASAKAERATAK